jgi:hypothetical protein
MSQTLGEIFDACVIEVFGAYATSIVSLFLFRWQDTTVSMGSVLPHHASSHPFDMLIRFQDTSDVHSAALLAGQSIVPSLSHPLVPSFRPCSSPSRSLSYSPNFPPICSPSPHMDPLVQPARSSAHVHRTAPVSPASTLCPLRPPQPLKNGLRSLHRHLVLHLRRRRRFAVCCTHSYRLIGTVWKIRVGRQQGT